MNENIEKLRKTLGYFNLVLLASKAGVCYPTLAAFRNGKTKSMTTETDQKIREVLEPIARDILGVNK